MTAISNEDSRSEVLRGLPFSDYLALSKYGSGAFIALRKSLKTFHWFHVLKNERHDTDALAFGRIAHMAILEPEDFRKRFIVQPKFDRRTKQGKLDFETFTEGLSPGAIVVKEDEAQALTGMIEALKNHPRANDLLKRGEAEVTVTADLEGLPVKGRFDFLVMDKDKDGKPHGLFCIDLKTTQDASPRAFQNQMLKRGWWIQAGLYSWLAEKAFGVPCIFVFVAIEKEPPYEVGIYSCDQSVIECGMAAVKQGAAKLKESFATNKWPGVCEDFTNVSMPDYLLNEFSVESEE